MPETQPIHACSEVTTSELIAGKRPPFPWCVTNDLGVPVEISFEYVAEDYAELPALIADIEV